ncbi:MAG: nitrile hydratase subunit beta [bacterium]|nr:nitrile hydratase subunit beta [bacterium]
MNGIHDLGGMEGFGAIEIEADEPTFHERWEGRAFALNMAGIGILRAYNADEYRHAVERMAPADYLGASYYERMLTGAATLLVEKGVVDRASLESLAGARFPLARPVADVTPREVAEPATATFAVGDRVRVREAQFRGHTRVPRYVRGKTGEVIRVAPAFSFPDTSAHGFTPRSEPTYHVEFEARELWREDDCAGESVLVDLWQSYLEPVE